MFKNARTAARGPLKLLLAFGLAAWLPACGTSPIDEQAIPDLSDRPLVGKFVWHDLITDDVKAARRFYGRLLGWEFEEARHPRGGAYTLIKANGRYIGGIVVRPDGGQADFSRWLPYLSVSDVDRSVSLTDAAGGETLVEPVALASIGRAAAVSDPQGAVLGLLRIRKGDPEDEREEHFGQVLWDELVTSDPAAAVAFYQSLAGYQAETLARNGGEYVVLEAQGHQRAGVLQRPNDDIQPQWLTHFAVTDVETAARRAADLGGRVLLAPSPDIRSGGFAILSDPTGAVLALTEYTP
jgi:predicted enzyme related to lactoylglutathione lyase